MFCHKNYHVYLEVCQSEILSNKKLEEFPDVVNQTGKQKQEIPKDGLCGSSIYPDVVCNSIYGLYPPSFLVTLYI